MSIHVENLRDWTYPELVLNLPSKIRKIPKIPTSSGRSPDSRESEPILKIVDSGDSRGSDSREYILENRDWTSPRIEVYSWESSRIGFDSRESGLDLSENRGLFSRIFRILRIFPLRFGRFRRFPRIDPDSRGGPLR